MQTCIPKPTLRPAERSADFATCLGCRYARVGGLCEIPQPYCHRRQVEPSDLLYSRQQTLPGSILGWALFWEGYEGKTLGQPEDIVGTLDGCISSGCAHRSHDPAARICRWSPPAGESLVYLGRYGCSRYYQLQSGTYVRARLADFHARLSIVESLPVGLWKLAESDELRDDGYH